MTSEKLVRYDEVAFQEIEQTFLREAAENTRYPSGTEFALKYNDRTMGLYLFGLSLLAIAVFHLFLRFVAPVESIRPGDVEGVPYLVAGMVLLASFFWSIVGDVDWPLQRVFNYIHLKKQTGPQVILYDRDEMDCEKVCKQAPAVRATLKKLLLGLPEDVEVQLLSARGASSVYARVQMPDEKEMRYYKLPLQNYGYPTYMYGSSAL